MTIPPAPRATNTTVPAGPNPPRPKRPAGQRYRVLVFPSAGSTYSSDYLIRAVAARRWLAAGGVASRIGVGARHAEDGAFMAHAWLMVGERMVTDGDTTPYEEFVRVSR